ncbi:MAG TPA: aspartate carbamoyltransferase catalytic subunit [Acidimicrobiia bacterium]
MKTLISIRTLGRGDLEALIEDASKLRESLDSGETVDRSLDGVCVANLFFEPSTRTRLSFDLAAQNLGAHVLNYFPETSSSTKGESLHDTALTVAAIGADILVVRHSEEGAPQSVAGWTGRAVVNAGDGAGEHPTQALLDAVTLSRRFAGLDGLRMAIVGDIAHSRVAGSLIHAMPALGVDVTLVGPERWLPADGPLAATTDLDGTIGDFDVAYLLRVQQERGGVIDKDYLTRYGFDGSRAARLKDDAVIMHPGPINRGVEISDEVAESPRSLIVEQVRNGVPTRMAVLRSLTVSR